MKYGKLRQQPRKRTARWMKSRLRRLDCLQGHTSGRQALRANELRTAIAAQEVQ